MRTLMALGVLGACLLLAPVPVRAHHAFAAEFDATKPVTFKGVVSKVEWTNPHMWIYVDVKDASGSIVTWAVEGGAPNALLRRGWRKMTSSLTSKLRARPAVPRSTFGWAHIQPVPKLKRRARNSPS